MNNHDATSSRGLRLLPALLTLTTLSLFSGCSLMKTSQDVPAGSTLQPASMKTSQEEPETLPPSPIPKDTLYSLMVAEFAGHRHQYDLALDQYLQQAARTGDPGIAERALRIAQYTGGRHGSRKEIELADAGQFIETFVILQAGEVILLCKGYLSSGLNGCCIIRI